MPHDVIDLSELEAQRTIRKNRCWFQRLTSEQQHEVVAAREAGITFVNIARMLKGWGEHLTSPSVSRHFSDDCTCSRPTSRRRIG